MANQSQNTFDQELAARRSRALGPAYRLFYERPLHVVRGEGTWLYDSDGRAYLDVYNNVAHVGHCHPHVVQAMLRQAETLNTNTRYLHETVVRYAERLTSLFPGDLKVCMFTCSGSEANELALRIAKAHSGGTGVVVTEHAYHGNTNTLTELSTTHKYVERPAHVKTCAAPDSYRGPYRVGEADVGQRYAALVGQALDALCQQGARPAAFLVDTIFATDGILTAPDNYFAEAVELVHAAGGLFVADEVQPGFGRTGDQMWCFERYAVVPDIVTLGKPMGNGHPLAAVVTTPRIMESFARSARYFNTFGGNTVSCAVGMAVLDVLERENLQANARQVGSFLKQSLEALQAKHEVIGDVRGAGLFLGVELVRNRKTREPAQHEAAAVVNALRERGVLIGLTGRDENVLKLRPPLVFTEQNARQVVDALDASMQEIAR